MFCAKIEFAEIDFAFLATTDTYSQMEYFVFPIGGDSVNFYRTRLLMRENHYGCSRVIPNKRVATVLTCSIYVRDNVT